MFTILNKRSLLLSRRKNALYNSSRNIITDIHSPECNKCTYYIPNTDNLYSNTTDTHCSKFGTKNIYNGKIKNYYIEQCREDNDKCGKKGIHFMRVPQLELEDRIKRHNNNDTYIIIICGWVVGMTAISVYV